MVTPTRTADRGDGRDRGQLILIGAITLAFIILGVVVVFNGVLYTETLSSTATSQGASDDTTIEAELAGGVSTVAHHVNLNESSGSTNQYNATLTGVIEGPDGYAEQYRDAKANSRPTIVNASVVGVTETATVTVGEPLPTVNAQVNQTVGHLEFHFESDDDGDTFEVEHGGDQLEIVDRNAGGFRIENGPDSCDTDADSLRLDVVAGVANASLAGDCELSIVDPSDSSNLLLRNYGVDGTFDMVVKGDSISPISLTNDHTGAWTVAVDVEYDSNDVSYEKRHAIRVYGDES